MAVTPLVRRLRRQQLAIRALCRGGRNAERGYRHQDELSKNVDFGDTIATPGAAAGVRRRPGPYGWRAGLECHRIRARVIVVPGCARSIPALPAIDPCCNFKLVLVNDGKNTASDFFMYTPSAAGGPHPGQLRSTTSATPRTAERPELRRETVRPPSFRFRSATTPATKSTASTPMPMVATTRLVPSTYRINAPMPTGVSPNMVQVCLNAPFKPDPVTIWAVHSGSLLQSAIHACLLHVQLLAGHDHVSGYAGAAGGGLRRHGQLAARRQLSERHAGHQVRLGRRQRH